MKSANIFILSLTLGCLAWTSSAVGQDFKVPIRLIVPYGAGGSTDVMARAVAPTLSAELGQPVLIENKPGANGQIGTQYVKTAKADGSTFLFTLDHSVVIVPLITPNVGYSFKDFQAVGKVGRFQWVFTTPLAGPAKTLPEFIDVARRDSSLRNVGVPIIGGVPQIMGEAVAKKVGADLTVIPFAGAGPLMPQLMGGQISAGIVGVGEALSMSASGKVRLLGISGSKRSSILPEVPTFNELGMPGVTLGTLYSVFAPKDLPRALAERFNKALALAVADPKVVQRAHEMSIELESTRLDDAQPEITTVAEFWRRALAASK
jgi:tripartite-type tricarboxylate transporter receptor subunit TctC